MANQEHLALLRGGRNKWNEWRRQHPEARPDFSEASLIETNLSRADLSQAILSRANLHRANLSHTSLHKTDLSFANLSHANLSHANLSFVNLSHANLSHADLSRVDLSRASLWEADLSNTNLHDANLSYTDLHNADLSYATLLSNLSYADLSSATLYGSSLLEADLHNTNLFNANLSHADLKYANLTNADLSMAILANADLSGAVLTEANLDSTNLMGARLVGTDLTSTNLSNCLIYGLSVWDVKLQGATQFNLVITHPNQPAITVDNLKVAQFIYLLLNNEEIRDIINTLTTKIVLILGRFTPKRKVVLDALRDALRNENYSPVLFDFDTPSTRNVTETVRTLAHLCRFIIADLTDPSSIPHELQAIAPTLAIPIQPLLEVSKREYSMFSDFNRYHWVLPIYQYTDLPGLLSSLKEKIIEPAEQKALELIKE